MDLVEFVAATNAAKSPSEVFDLFAKAASDLGLDRAVYTEGPVLPFGEGIRSGLVVGCPESRAGQGGESGNDGLVPKSEFCAVSTAGNLWEDLPGNVASTSDENACTDQSDEAEQHNCVCIPLWGPFGPQGRVGLASSDPAVDVRPKLDVVRLLTVQFNNAYSRLVETTQPGACRPMLTLREREILSLCFKGKSSGMIGDILDISDNAVNFHIKNAMKKLNCSSRMLCVLKAIRLRLILP